jgi:serine/threonine protein kinase
MTATEAKITDVLATSETPSVLLDDQRRRWLEGERVLVEEYCRRAPSLKDDTESLLDLIYSEVLLRELQGEQPRLAEYVERFPDVAGPLRVQFELDQAIRESESVHARSGSVIGRYTLLELIGEGGMGAVYIAQQDRPVCRRVALKIIKPGMDTKEVIARFEAERQALALMEHPHIAKVFDAGTTGPESGCSGRPYFVMELVRGVPITAYCDQHALSVRARLELFVEVCHAVQHAHQKGIIHRDLKPSNVLIAEEDGRGVPKIIDFGLAKAMGQQLTEKTLFTVYPQVVGTPLYMSPEQADLTTRDIDTRADVYSLGAMLYELLTGATPFDPARFRATGFDEVRRIVREEDPPCPSMRIRLLEDASEIAAVNRGTDCRRLRQLVAGDLDWIVMRCLEKDRARRYGTANALARDIERFLNDEPVEAGPPSRTYRVRKFVHRNKAGVLAGSAITAALVAAIAILAESNARIRGESAAKDASLATTREVVRQMTNLASQHDARLAGIPQGEAIYIALRQDTLRYLEPIVKQAEIDEDSNYEIFHILESMADIQMDLGRYDEARATCNRAIEIVQERLAVDPDNREYLADLGYIKRCMVRIMWTQVNLENEPEAELVAYGSELVDMLREYNRRYPENLQSMIHPLLVLGCVAEDRQGDKLAAELLFRECLSHSEEYLPRNETSGPGYEWQWASASARRLGRIVRDKPTAGADEAAPILEKALRWSNTLRKTNPSRWAKYEAAVAELELGICYFQMHPTERAIAHVRHASDELRRLSVEYPSVADTDYVRPARRAQGTLVRQLQQAGRLDEAAEAARQMADWLSDISPRIPDDPKAQSELQLAQAETFVMLVATGQLSETLHMLPWIPRTEQPISSRHEPLPRR